VPGTLVLIFFIIFCKYLLT